MECLTCNIPLTGTKALREHVRLNPGCIWIKTISPKDIENEFKNEVKRQKDSNLYKKRPAKDRKQIYLKVLHQLC